VTKAYLQMLLRSARQPSSTELRFSPIQMHSLHTLWELLLPWPRGIWVLYLLSSLVVIAMAAAIWKSSAALAFRFSALLLASVLVNPHLYIYDLLVLAPLFLLLVNWTLENPQPASTPGLQVLLYCAFILPLFGPLARWTHLQLSVIVFVALLWTVFRYETGSHKLASRESAVI
jgi:hypothetical protein